MRISIPRNRWMTFTELALHCHVKTTSERFRNQLSVMVWHGYVDAKFSFDDRQRTIVLYRKNFKK
jgi:hypothetical protein